MVATLHVANMEKMKFGQQVLGTVVAQDREMVCEDNAQT